MGMAASQARFLTLTARKSNVEYEGQQVNQERTSLANESSGLFNKMMALQVPTPPSATDFYNTRYTFESTGMDYSITSTTPRTDGRYDMVIAYKTVEDTAKAKPTTGTMNFASGIPSSIGIQDKECPITILNRNADGDFVDEAGKIDTNVKTVANIAGEDLTSDANAVFYKYTYNDVTYYVSGTNMKPLIDAAGDAASYDISNTFPSGLSAFYITDKPITKTLTAIGAFPETTSEGRFEQLRVDEITSEGVDENVQKSLKDKFFDLSLTQVKDDEGYATAMKDYEYQKMLYERTINDINAQTEIIQQQDRTLELRLKQLDTEQNALNTELEAVKKVIETNVEATFKTFA